MKWNLTWLATPLLLVGLAQAADRPNILVILTDDQGWGDLHIHGNTALSTPNIDRIAQEGTRFVNAYSMPKCTPTRATLLTGQYPYRHGWVNHWDVPRWGAGWPSPLPAIF